MSLAQGVAGAEADVTKAVQGVEHAVGAALTTAVAVALQGLGLVKSFALSLKANGIDPFGLDDLVVAQVDNVQAVQTDYDNGQAVVLGALPIVDSSGSSVMTVVGVKQGGTVYTQLFG